MTDSISLGDLRIDKTPDMIDLLRRVLSTDKQTSLNARASLIAIMTEITSQIIEQSLPDVFVRIVDTPLSDLSLVLPVPDTFKIDHFNQATTEWRRYRVSNPDKQLGPCDYVLLGKRQMREIREWSRHAASIDTTKKATPKQEEAEVLLEEAERKIGSPTVPVFAVNLIEKDQENWFELTDRLPEVTSFT